VCVCVVSVRWVYAHRIDLPQAVIGPNNCTLEYKYTQYISTENTGNQYTHTPVDCFYHARGYTVMVGISLPNGTGTGVESCMYT
jgi:hypothetical protein